MQLLLDSEFTCGLKAKDYDDESLVDWFDLIEKGLNNLKVLIEVDQQLQLQGADVRIEKGGVTDNKVDLPTLHIETESLHLRAFVVHPLWDVYGRSVTSESMDADEDTTEYDALEAVFMQYDPFLNEQFGVENSEVGVVQNTCINAFWLLHKILEAKKSLVDQWVQYIDWVSGDE